MRVHVISDMEGVSGIARREQTNAGEALFEEGRKLYTEDINATVRGAKAAGATEIVVVDCHGAGNGFTFLLPGSSSSGSPRLVQRAARRRRLT
jgi:D-amino peptidase